MGDWNLTSDPLEALREGDPRPFEAFVRSHARLLVAWFRRQGAGLHRAEDLTQDVFFKLHSNAARYVARERFGAYCMRVVRNLWIDDCRRRGARPATLSLDGEAGGSDGDGSGRSLAEALAPGAVRQGPTPALQPARRAENREADAALQLALQSLSPAHREAFDLAVLEGLAYPDISALLNVPVGTVKSRVFYALRRLRERLADAGVEDVDPDGGDAPSREERA